MANKRIAFPISEETWTPEGVVSAYPSMPNRPVASYRIGMRENGDQKYFINEPIFVDVYHRILKKEVKCYVNLYQYPYLVCVKDGRLVPHNMAFFELLSAVDTAMEDIRIHNKIRAFTGQASSLLLLFWDAKRRRLDTCAALPRWGGKLEIYYI